MEKNSPTALTGVDLVAFDLDDTLVISKQSLDAEMALLLQGLLAWTRVAVVSGASFAQIERQFLAYLPPETKLANLFLVPTNGARLYDFQNNRWHPIYEISLSPAELATIQSAFGEAFHQSPDLVAKKIYGELVENRGTQVTFSGLGSDAPVALKQVWDPDRQKRERLAAVLRPLLLNFSIGFGGMTSIDVTKRGIDKAYGLERLAEHLGVPLAKCMYVGDALYPGGNDAVVNRLNLRTVPVGGVDDTKKFISNLLGSAEPSATK